MFRDLYPFLLLLMLLVGGQSRLLMGQHLTFLSSPEDQKILNSYAVSVRQPDSLSVKSAISQLISQLQMDGYFEAKAEMPVQTGQDHWEVVLQLGPRYQWAYLLPGNLDPVMQEKSGFRERFFLNRPFAYSDIQKLMDRIITAAENEGFPFASLRLSNIRINESQVQAEIDYKPGPYITFGKLHIHGTDKVKADFLASSLRVPEGSAYSEKKLQQLTGHLKNIPYLDQAEEIEVRFQNDEAELHLALSDRESNQVDALLNFLPNENKPGQLLLTGRAEILLNNLMRSGKQLQLQWQRLQLASQQLLLSYQHPYLLRTPLQAGLSFRLLKEDTLFINRDLQLGFSYPLSKGGSLGISTSMRNSSLLSERAVDQQRTEPMQLADFSLLSLQVNWQLSKLDDVHFPAKGIATDIELGMGRKMMSEKTFISTDMEAPSTLWQITAEANLRQYHRIGKTWSLYHRMSGAWTDARQLFLNDLYRLGGLNSLRGFNDNFFFASAYALSNLELRLLLEQTADEQSFLYLFYDQAWLMHGVGETYLDFPLGLGGGMSISTGAGNFMIAYALGKQQGKPLDVNLSKIHFGYVSHF
ncbi:MAG: BamA/TamA family outer membrane protein [Cyclobacteriaceae bacterium]